MQAVAARLRSQGKRLVFTNGVFDILHRGHVEYLRKARALGNVLIVGLNTDAGARRLKGPGRPVQPFRDRAAVLASLRAVDFVVPFGADTPLQLIRRVKPDVLVKGADYRLTEIAGADFVRGRGGVVKRMPLTRGRSTSALLAKWRRR